MEAKRKIIVAVGRPDPNQVNFVPFFLSENMRDEWNTSEQAMVYDPLLIDGIDPSKNDEESLLIRILHMLELLEKNPEVVILCVISAQNLPKMTNERIEEYFADIGYANLDVTFQEDSCEGGVYFCYSITFDGEGPPVIYEHGPARSFMPVKELISSRHISVN
jgi:hypothetical protein